MFKTKRLAVLCLLTAFMCLASGCDLIDLIFHKGEEGENVTIESDKPSYESRMDREIVLPAERDFEGQKELALYLYRTANKAFQDCPACAYEVDSKTVTTIPGLMSIDIQGCRFCLKTQEEYYYTEYSYAPKGEKVVGLFSNKESSMFSCRKYTDTSMDYLYCEKVYYSSVDVNEDGQFEVEADWSESNRIPGYPKHEEIPVYNSNQSQTYEQTDQQITENTITSAKVTHNDAEGYYIIELTLDAGNPETTKKTLGTMQEGLEGANYTSIVETIEIWDNGYYKSFLSVDNASNGSLSLELNFKTYFHYSPSKITPEAYTYFVEAKEMAKQ